MFNEIKTQISAVQEGMIEVRDAVMCGNEMTTFNDVRVLIFRFSSKK